jgi:hypothetical protein
MAAQETDLIAGARGALAGHVASLLKLVATLAASAFIAYGAAQYRAGESETRTDLRIGAVEQKAQALAVNVVPRVEHEAHWKAMEDAQRELKSDLREVRETNKQILLKLSR